MLGAHIPNEITAVTRFPEAGEHQLLSTIQFDFIPNSFFSRLIVRSLSLFLSEAEEDPYSSPDNSESQDSEDVESPPRIRRITNPKEHFKVQKPPLLWTEGLHLVVQDIQILIRKYPMGNKIDVQIRGPESQKTRVNELYCMVFDMVNGLLDQWPALAVQRSVACIQCGKERKVSPGLTSELIFRSLNAACSRRMSWRSCG